MTIEIKGLAEFRRDLKAAGLGTKEATAVMRAAGEPVLKRAVGYAPRATGALAASARIQPGGSKGRVIFKTAYAAGAEFGRSGRWKGFDKWGMSPRYGYRALGESEVEVAELITKGLTDVLTVAGWFEEG